MYVKFIHAIHLNNYRKAGENQKINFEDPLDCYCICSIAGVKSVKTMKFIILENFQLYGTYIKSI